ncbi:MAG: hypothetical protein HDQ88_08860 [Clostridia bacterium]|nr:hypothetical protein [Clostridia bacterium]
MKTQTTMPDGTTRTKELSYLDLIAGLTEDIESDECMPGIIKGVALELADKLRTLIEPYSA